MTERLPVESSLIRSISYDFASSLLEVEFLDGRSYEYFDVPYSVYLEFTEADSKGSFFNQSIRDGYDHRAIASRE